MFLFNFSVYTLDRVVLKDIDTAERPESTHMRSSSYPTAADVARAQVEVRPLGGWIATMLRPVPRVVVPVPRPALPVRPAVPKTRGVPY